MKNKCFKEEGWLDFRPDRAKTLLELPEKREREREGGGRDRMALQCNTGAVATSLYLAGNSHRTISNRVELRLNKRSIGVVFCSSSSGKNHNSSGGDGGSKKGVPNSNYVVPMDSSFSSSSITRPLAEILRDLNKRIPDNIVNSSLSSTFIPWYHANRMLSFYAPGWCGEIRDVIFSENGSVTVVYRLTIRGSDGEAHRESTGTVSSSDGDIKDPVAAAEEIAFGKACARFGLGLYLYHEE